MTATLDQRVLTDPLPGRVSVIPVTDGDRPVGAWIVTKDSAVFRPVVDVSRLVDAAVGLATIAAITTATAAMVRRRPTIGTITMGPGGWVSLKNTRRPALRSGDHRPWWARILRARRLVPES
jgi:hypothetical protein